MYVYTSECLTPNTRTNLSAHPFIHDYDVLIQALFCSAEHVVNPHASCLPVCHSDMKSTALEAMVWFIWLGPPFTNEVIEKL